MLYFFDTSGLKYRYCTGAHTTQIRRIISSKANECHISEITVLEISSALASRCRGEGRPLKEFVAMDKAFWRDLDDGRLHIRPISRQDLLRARHLMRYSAETQVSVTSADALIATSAMELALERKQRVTLCLEDWRLYKVIREVGAYTSVLNFLYLGVDKDAAGSAKAPATAEATPTATATATVTAKATVTAGTKGS